MNRESAVYKVLSQEKIPQLDMGGALSIHNNANHPQLNGSTFNELNAVKVELDAVITDLQEIGRKLRALPIRPNEFYLAINFLNSYGFIINETLIHPKNEKIAMYAQSKAVQHG